MLVGTGGGLGAAPGGGAGQLTQRDAHSASLLQVGGGGSVVGNEDDGWGTPSEGVGVGGMGGCGRGGDGGVWAWGGWKRGRKARAAAPRSVGYIVAPSRQVGQ